LGDRKNRIEKKRKNKKNKHKAVLSSRETSGLKTVWVGGGPCPGQPTHRKEPGVVEERQKKKGRKAPQKKGNINSPP